jgi:hypothetical protein
MIDTEFSCRTYTLPARIMLDSNGNEVPVDQHGRPHVGAETADVLVDRLVRKTIGQLGLEGDAKAYTKAFESVKLNPAHRELMRRYARGL